MSNLDGRWWTYRYSVYRNVLKKPETKVVIAEKNGDLASSFDLNGWDDRVEVKMRANTAIDAMLGGKDSIDVRWTPIECGGTTVLGGYAADRVGFDRTDFFAAVKPRRTNPLPVAETYTFDCSRVTPLDPSLPSEAGTRVVVDLNKMRNEIVFNGESYKISESTPYEHGLKVTGSHYEKHQIEGTIRIWILPVGPTGRLLAIGYWYYMHDEPAIEPTSPFDVHCNKAIHLCQTC